MAPAPPWVSGPETQRVSEVSEGWQFSHTARIWCLLEGEKQHSRKIRAAASGEKLICLAAKRAASLEEEKRGKKKIRTSAASKRLP